MKKLAALIVLTLSFVSCENLDEIELQAKQAIEDNKLLKAECNISSFAPSRGVTYTNISSSYDPRSTVTTELRLVNGAVASDASLGKCAVILVAQSCPTCRFAPQYKAEYVISADSISGRSDSCSLSDGNIVSINLTDKENITCSVSAPRQQMSKSRSF